MAEQGKARDLSDIKFLIESDLKKEFESQLGFQKVGLKWCSL